MDLRTLSDEYTQIGQTLIDNEPCLEHIRESEAVILFLTAQHRKVNADKLVYEGAVESFSDEQKKTLLLHELLHVGIEHGENGEKYSIVPHDLEDFKMIIDRFGVDWDKTDE